MPTPWQSALRPQAQFAIEQETDLAKTELKREVAELSAALAEDLLKQNINAEDQNRLVDEYLTKVGAGVTVTNQIVAKRYAKALLEIGKEDGKLDTYASDLAQVAGLLDEAPELENALANPAFAIEERKSILTVFLDKLGISSIASNFYKLLLDRGRIDGAKAIAGLYAELLDEERGIKRAEVVSATPLDEAAISRLTETLKQVAGQEVQLEVKEDSSLIGGVVARIGDLVLDGSVKSQLENLKGLT
jgi:F-type H+-transporting ATPase subunit delta